jgi:hypothetical protein
MSVGAMIEIGLEKQRHVLRCAAESAGRTGHVLKFTLQERSVDPSVGIHQLILKWSRRLPETAVVHSQGRKNTCLDIILETQSADALYNISGEGGSVVRVGHDLSGRKNADRCVLPDIFGKWGLR